ncbi:uncharacterized protein BDZ99DRAFT_267070 [Mytilinidion resinicola]|uniref:Uncharacterized protein n=1 Tax=Mytilinidion resinicola TaxID=574789 RepID=A0A6A6YUK9_9PEZI|nr:uncharacterized protein BDZ99DRAFT_267070 [Mytilinidion resinicola]KAF2812461.1 hypothetical protein BDZ99DRAFT_267070 [Mytilinidion resinicola]
MMTPEQHLKKSSTRYVPHAAPCAQSHQRQPALHPQPRAHSNHHHKPQFHQLKRFLTLRTYQPPTHPPSTVISPPITRIPPPVQVPSPSPTEPTPQPPPSTFRNTSNTPDLQLPLLHNRASPTVIVSALSNH